MSAPRFCACGKRLDNRNRTGKCHPCYAKGIALDPARQARMAEGWRRAIADPLKRDRILANLSKAAKSKVAWCPPEHMGAYRHLVYRKRIRAADARRMIEAEITGTPEHAKRAVAQAVLNMQLKHEREVGSRYNG